MYILTPYSSSCFTLLSNCTHFPSHLLKVRHTFHWARRPHLPPQLPAQHGLRDVREPHPHLRHRLHQGPDEQLPGPRACPGPPTEHQHHLTKPEDGEHQDQSGGAGNPRGGVPGARRTQEGPAGHGTLPEIRCWADSLSGEGNWSCLVNLNCCHVSWYNILREPLLETWCRHRLWERADKIFQSNAQINQAVVILLSLRLVLQHLRLLASS